MNIIPVKLIKPKVFNVKIKQFEPEPPSEAQLKKNPYFKDAKDQNEKLHRVERPSSSRIKDVGLLDRERKKFKRQNSAINFNQKVDLIDKLVIAELENKDDLASNKITRKDIL